MHDFLTLPQAPSELIGPLVGSLETQHENGQHLVQKMHPIPEAECHLQMNELVPNLMVSDQSLEPELHSMWAAGVEMAGAYSHSVPMNG